MFARRVSAARRDLLNACLLQMRSAAITHRHVDDTAWSETHEYAVLRQLYSVDQLALAVYDVVDRNTVDVLARSDPKISIGVRPRRSGCESGSVVRKLARRDHGDLWE